MCHTKARLNIILSSTIAAAALALGIIGCGSPTPEPTPPPPAPPKVDANISFENPFNTPDKPAKRAKKP